jgi:3-phenylpropionate/trans-cinnamate dioxygenase ferredoxin subunit
VSAQRVAALADIVPGTTLRVELAGLSMLLCNVDGTIYSIEDVCTHDGGPLDQGELEGACVVCPRHGATFDVRSGAATMPAVMPVSTFPVEIRGDGVFIDL